MTFPRVWKELYKFAGQCGVGERGEHREDVLGSGNSMNKGRSG